MLFSTKSDNVEKVLIKSRVKFIWMRKKLFLKQGFQIKIFDTIVTSCILQSQ